MSVDVYRAPMRSRRDDVDVQATIDRAMSLQVCGFGGILHPPPPNLDGAVESAIRQYDDRLARRIERFAAALDGSLVWTRDANLLFWVGRIAGPWSYDPSDVAAEVDLVHVRPCEWSESPISEHEAPAAVLATFGRGGRNLQQIHDTAVGVVSQRIWAATRRRAN
ncbi:MAG: hypothetical protein QOD90_4094 [Mycobacterium sp.]|nr:hypothetical protein [Mycobacterium sp.]